MEDIEESSADSYKVNGMLINISSAISTDVSNKVANNIFMKQKLLRKDTKKAKARAIK